MNLAFLFIISMLTVQLAVASSSLCVLRSTFADVVVHNATYCSESAVNNETSLQCPEESQTFLTGMNCCVSDQFLNDNCDFRLTSNSSNISSSIPVVFVDNATHLLHIVNQDGSKADEAIIQHKDGSVEDTTSTIQNISFLSALWETVPENFTIVNSSRIMVMGGKHSLNGVYKLDLNHSTIPIQKQCLHFKLVSSLEEVLTVDNFTGAIAKLNACQDSTSITSSEITTSSDQTVSSNIVTGGATTTEELSIWLRYNRLLIYVVIGGGCGVGLLLVFIIMLCLLIGCIVKRRQKKARRRHQLETAPSIRYRHRGRSGENGSRCQQNLSYSLTTYENDENTELSPPSEETAQEPQPFPQLRLVRAETPMVPTITTTVTVEVNDEVTFDTFKRSQKNSKPAPPDTPTIHTPEQGYYDTVAPTVKTTNEEGPTEEYDVLVRSSSRVKGQSMPKLNTQYSHLNLNLSKSPAPDPPSQATPYSQRSIYSPSPSPVPPPIPSMELLNPRNKAQKDILTSSWSKPSAMDKVASHSTPELLEIYDCPTELAFAPPKPPLKPIKRARGRFIIGEGDSEVVYDVPPIRKISDDTSLGSYVDMQSQFYML